MANISTEKSNEKEQPNGANQRITATVSPRTTFVNEGATNDEGITIFLKTSHSTGRSASVSAAMKETSAKMKIQLKDILLLRKWMSSPGDITLGNDGAYIVTDGKSHCVGKIVSGGSIELLCWGKDGLPKTASMMQPYGIVALSTTEPIFLFTDYKNGCIMKYDRRRDNCHMWNKGHSDLKEPTGISRDECGNVYVANDHDTNIHVFDKDGKHKKKFGEMYLKKPGLIAVNKDDLYVADRSDGMHVFHLNGEHRFKVNLGKKRTAHGIAFDKDNNIFISTRLPRVLGLFTDEIVLVANGDWNTIVEVGGTGGFSKIRGLCINQKEDTLAVVDGGNNRVAVYQITYNKSTLTEEGPKNTPLPPDEVSIV